MKKLDAVLTILMLLVVFVSLIAIPILVFILLKIMGALNPNLLTSGEDAFAAAGLTAWFLLIGTLLVFPVSYTLSMRLAVYLREKRGWEIQHPRRLFALAVLIIFALPLLVWLL